MYTLIMFYIYLKKAIEIPHLAYDDMMTLNPQSIGKK